MCAGHKAGAEAAIHAMQSIFLEENSQGVLLIDASNAFNSLNRRVALHNVQILCPRASTILINTYRCPSRLLITGGGEMQSQEGTTQGDPLAMPFYAVSTSLLIALLHSSYDKVRQVWLADDASAARSLILLKNFFTTLKTEGEKFGYIVNEKKSWQILKKSEDLVDARHIFQGLSIQITTEGQRHLGASIGSSTFKEAYVNGKVNSWLKELENLCNIAESQPPAPYSAFIFGFVHKFTYYLRTIPDIAQLLLPIEQFIASKLIPILFGCEVPQEMREILALPNRLGGMSIVDLMKESGFEYEASKSISASHAALIVQKSLRLLVKPGTSVLSELCHVQETRELLTG